MKFIITVIALLLSFNVFAQHEHHQTTAPKTSKPVVKQPVKKKSTATKKTVSKKAPVPAVRKDTISRDTMQIKQDSSEHQHHAAADSTPAPGHEHLVKDSVTVPAAHEHMMQDSMKMDNTGKHDMQHQGHDMMQHDSAGSNMSHAFSKNLPMTRNGSGTSWLPDNSPMYAYMFHSKKWMYMLHGNIFLRYNKQDIFDNGNRGGEKFDAPNMWMFMGQREVGKNGLFHFSSMISFDPLTVGESGYPLLFQTGESYKGTPLIDRQHPHDLISELSVAYSHALSKKADVFVYLGYPGEPALGPSAFVHRPSGFLNPDAPLTHHWVDATHITFGVATIGARYGKFKLEGSSFTGREPDENRYDFDKPRFDSWSGRLSFNPSAAWSMQVSHGFIQQPELLHPGEDVNRTTASVQFSSIRNKNIFTNVTALWGMNKTKGHDGENGLLLEATQQWRKIAVYGRYEWVQKSGEELLLDENQFDHDDLFPVNALTLGTAYDLLQVGKTKLSLGVQASYYKPDKRLDPLYGKNLFAGQVYLRVFPMAMRMK